jgi:hypothetical protein
MHEPPVAENQSRRMDPLIIGCAAAGLLILAAGLVVWVNTGSVRGTPALPPVASPTSPPDPSASNNAAASKLAKPVPPIVTRSPASHWCILNDVGLAAPGMGSNPKVSPEMLSAEGLVGEPLNADWYVLLHADPASIVDGADAKPGEIVTDVVVHSGEVWVSIELPQALALKLKGLTKNPQNLRLALVLDGKVMAIPTVLTPLGAHLSLPAGTRADAEWMAARIRDQPSALRLQRGVAPGELVDEQGLRSDFRSTSK